MGFGLGYGLGFGLGYGFEFGFEFGSEFGFEFGFAWPEPGRPQSAQARPRAAQPPAAAWVYICIYVHTYICI